MIVVTGASSQLGRLVIESLLKRCRPLKSLLPCAIPRKWSIWRDVVSRFARPIRAASQSDSRLPRGRQAATDFGQRAWAPRATTSRRDRCGQGSRRQLSALIGRPTTPLADLVGLALG